jgi:hypothetical protein
MLTNGCCSPICVPYGQALAFSDKLSDCASRDKPSDSDGRPRLETLSISVSSYSPPLLHYSSVLAKAFIISAVFGLFLLSLLLTLCYSAANNDNLMTPTKSPTVFLRRAREKGSEKTRVGIDSTKVHRRLDPEAERRYDATMALWTE